MNPFEPTYLTLSPPPCPSGDDPRVAAALEEYLALLSSGEKPSRAEWLSRHADIAHALGECLDGLMFVQSAARQLSDGDPYGPARGGLPAATMLGDYRIVREVGRGGMGVVYEAEQVSLARRVALKVLPAAASLDRHQRQRFQVEAQVAGHLHHPHIVPVFGVGCVGEVPYYAMQFIEGRTLADVIRERSRAVDRPGRHEPRPTPSTPPVSTVPDGPTGSPPDAEPPASGPPATHPDPEYFRYAARLGVEAAEALDHAHGLGVVHRDVKPSNLMVDDRGALWVTDFGLARFDGEEGLTRTGDVLGTLRYMSPEQAQARRGVVDQRTDVYSLGATLYELATLRPAFDGRDRQEVLNQIAQQEPPPPRRVNASIPRDLETIVLKAMAKEVHARYATAQDLADDLKRFLDDRPVLARRPTRLDRAAKWSRRHRTPVAAATLTLVVGLAVGTALLWRERSQTLLALDALKQARRREQAGMTLFFSTTDAIAMNAMGRLASARPEEGRQSGWFYRQALESYEQLAGLYQGDREMQAVAAEAYRRVGFVRMILRYNLKLDDFAKADAEGAYRQALGLCERLVAEKPLQVEPGRLHASVLNEYGDMLVRLGRLPQAEPLYLQGLAIQSRLAAAHPADRDLARDLSERGSLLAQIYSATGRRQDAKALFLEALRLRPDDPENLNNYAWFLASHLANTPDAVEPSEAVNMSRRAVALEPRSAAYWNTLGLALHRAGDEGGAEEAVKNSMKFHAPDPNDWVLLALIHAAKGERSEARARLDDTEAWVKQNGPQAGDVGPLLREALRVLGESDPAVSSSGKGG